MGRKQPQRDLVGWKRPARAPWGLKRPEQAPLGLDGFVHFCDRYDWFVYMQEPDELAVAQSVTIGGALVGLIGDKVRKPPLAAPDLHSTSALVASHSYSCSFVQDFDVIAKNKFGKFPVPRNFLNHTDEAKQAAKAAARAIAEAAAEEEGVKKSSSPKKAVTKLTPQKMKAADKLALEPAVVNAPVDCAEL